MENDLELENKQLKSLLQNKRDEIINSRIQVLANILESVNIPYDIKIGAAAPLCRENGKDLAYRKADAAGVDIPDQQRSQKRRQKDKGGAVSGTDMFHKGSSCTGADASGLVIILFLRANA